MIYLLLGGYRRHKSISILLQMLDHRFSFLRIVNIKSWCFLIRGRAENLNKRNGVSAFDRTLYIFRCYMYLGKCMMTVHLEFATIKDTIYIPASCLLLVIRLLPQPDPSRIAFNVHPVQDTSVILHQKFQDQAGARLG